MRKLTCSGFSVLFILVSVLPMSLARAQPSNIGSSSTATRAAVSDAAIVKEIRTRLTVCVRSHCYFPSLFPSLRRKYTSKLYASRHFQLAEWHRGNLGRYHILETSKLQPISPDLEVLPYVEVVLNNRSTCIAIRDKSEMDAEGLALLPIVPCLSSWLKKRASSAMSTELVLNELRIYLDAVQGMFFSSGWTPNFRSLLPSLEKKYSAHKLKLDKLVLHNGKVSVDGQCFTFGLSSGLVPIERCPIPIGLTDSQVIEDIRGAVVAALAMYQPSASSSTSVVLGSVVTGTRYTDEAISVIERKYSLYKLKVSYMIDTVQQRLDLPYLVFQSKSPRKYCLAFTSDRSALIPDPEQRCMKLP